MFHFSLLLSRAKTKVAALKWLNYTGDTHYDVNDDYATGDLNNSFSGF